MEFYGIYEILNTIFSLSFGDTIKNESNQAIGLVPSKMSFILSVSIAGGIIALLFLLQGFGLYRMAKKRNIKHKWRAFVPFASTLLMGKLAGECTVFKQKMKRAGLYAMILQILSLAVCVLSIVLEGLLFIRYSGNLQECQDASSHIAWTGLPSNARWMAQFYHSGGLIRTIVDLPYILLLYIVLLGLYRKYNAKNSMMLSIVTLLIPVSHYIIVLAVRNNTAIDYEAYMQAKREEFLRRQQQYGSPYGPYGPYGNPYANPYNRPSQNPYDGAPKETPKDPFEEFGGEDDDPFFDGASQADDSPFEEDFGGKDSSDGLFD